MTSICIIVLLACMLAFNSKNRIMIARTVLVSTSQWKYLLLKVGDRRFWVLKLKLKGRTEVVSFTSLFPSQCNCCTRICTRTQGSDTQK